MADRPTERETLEAIERLTAEVARLNGHRFVRIHNSLPRLIAFQLARGLAFGLGTLMGATVLVSILAWWVSQMAFVPVLGDWLTTMMQQIEQGR